MATKTTAANTITETVYCTVHDDACVSSYFNTVNDAQVKLTSQQNGARDLGLDPSDWTLGQVTKTTTYSDPAAYKA